MASQNNTLPIAVVFSNLFRNLPRMVLTNLVFAVPVAAVIFLLRLLSFALRLNDQAAVFVHLLVLIAGFPFYAGVVKITAKMAAGEEKVAVLRGFFSAVKENFGRFLLHGAVLYVAALFSYVSLSLYTQLLSQSTLFLGPMIISVIVLLLLLFMFFYLPAMTVFYDMPIKHLYKNSFLMACGELKKNFIALFGLFCLAVICTSLLIFCYGSRLAVVIITIALAVLLVPAVGSFLIHAAVFERMNTVIGDKNERARAIDQKILKTQEKLQKDTAKDDFRQRLQKLEIDDSLPDSEYIYFDGRMITKGALLKLKQEALESEEN